MHSEGRRKLRERPVTDAWGASEREMAEPPTLGQGGWAGSMWASSGIADSTFATSMGVAGFEQVVFDSGLA